MAHGRGHMSADYLKEIHAVFDRDPRAQIDLNAHHARIMAIHLSAEVPQEVVVMFDTARNVALYSWFVYRFIPVVESLTYSTLEYALRLRMLAPGEAMPDRSPGLRKLLRKALRAGWIRQDSISQVKVLRRLRDAASDTPRSVQSLVDQYMEGMPDRMAKIRNSYAHGSTAIHGYHVAFGALLRCSEIVNEMWRSTQAACRNESEPSTEFES